MLRAVTVEQTYVPAVRAETTQSRSVPDTSGHKLWVNTSLIAFLFVIHNDQDRFQIPQDTSSR